MPYKRRTYKKKKTTLAPSRRTGKTTASYPNRINRSIGFPRCMKMRLRYAETVSFSGVPPLTQQFRLNSLYDPDATSSGHQCMYFDQVMAIYGNFVVTGCRITCIIQQTNVNDYPAAYVMDVRNDNSTRTGSNIGQRIEDGGATYATVGYAGGGSPSKTFTRYVNIGRQYGMKRNIDTSDDNWSGSASGNPNNEVYATIQGMAISSSTNNISSYLNFVLDYDCCFFNKLETAQS